MEYLGLLGDNVSDAVANRVVLPLVLTKKSTERADLNA